MIRLLYAGAANLAQPSSGMDLGSRCHFEELADDPAIEMNAVSVSAGPIDPAVPPSRPVRMVEAEMPRERSPVRRLARKLRLLAQGGILFQTGFLSRPAAAALREGLAGQPDVLVIDHIAALANLPLPRLVLLRLLGRTKIVVISHDISSELLRDRARLSPSRLKGLAIRLSAMHCHLYEIIVFGLAHRVFFVSTDDRDNFKAVRRDKTEAMCQVIEIPPGPPSDEGYGDVLVFVGSPSFFPNGAAIEWISRWFAPELERLLPSLRILLIGKGTDRLHPPPPANVIGLGFVDDERLHRLLRGSRGTLSPVVHGAGIKIKVLEAIAAGCAVFATEPSLRGYEFMGLEPLLDVEDPLGSAERVSAVVGDPARLAAYRRMTDERWQAYKQARRGRLARFVTDLFAPVPGPAAQH